MRRKKQKGASLGVIGSYSPKSTTENTNQGSTNEKDNEKHCTLHSATGYATISLGGFRTARRLGGLYCKPRRLIAAPLRGVFLLAVSRTHGVSLPKTLTGTPYGNPKGLLFPWLQSANLYGVAHPLGGGVGFTTDNLNQGDSHE